MFNIIVQLYCNMCTKSPVREIATIEGTSIHQRLTNYHNQWESGLLVIIYNTKYTLIILHIFLCWLSSSSLVNQKYSNKK